MTISNDSRTRIKKVFEPVALGMGRLGLTPDALTLIGFAITVVGAILVSQQFWLAGGVVILVGGVFDMFDGTLARATGRVSRLGAFMDSVFDRAGELVVYLGILAGTSHAFWSIGSRNEIGILPLLAAAAMAAAFMVSYTRAKAENLGFTAGNGMASVGLAPREVRIVILTVGLVLTGIGGGVCTTGDCDFFASQTPLGVLGDGTDFLAGALALITVLATITTIQRILHVRNQARTQSTQI